MYSRISFACYILSSPILTQTSILKMFSLFSMLLSSMRIPQTKSEFGKSPVMTLKTSRSHSFYTTSKESLLKLIWNSPPCELISSSQHGLILCLNRLIALILRSMPSILWLKNCSSIHAFDLKLTLELFRTFYRRTSFWFRYEEYASKLWQSQSNHWTSWLLAFDLQSSWFDFIRIHSVPIETIKIRAQALWEGIFEKPQ